MLLGAVLFLGFFFSNANPLWKWLAERPRTLDRQNLENKFDGLVRFGLPGSRCEFRECESDDVVCFLKDSNAGESRITVRVGSAKIASEFSSGFLSRAGLAVGSGARVESLGAGLLSVDGAGPARLEALLRLVVAALNHSPETQYRCSTTGPVDYEAVDDFYYR